MRKILFVFGTRPEAIKMAPIIKRTSLSSSLKPIILVTAQHRQMLDQVLNLFQIGPDFDLNLMKPNQDLSNLTISLLEGCKNVYQAVKPDLILVHGDTTTTMAAALAAFYQKIDVAHVEAGLRTFNNMSPYPEEMNRLITSRISKYHFAPTQKNATNLINEGINDRNILITGNTVIDALLEIKSRIEMDPNFKTHLENYFNKLIPGFGTKKIILITGHRRENLGEGLSNVCLAIGRLAKKFESVHFIFPVHLNPQVQNTVYNHLLDYQNVHLIPPQEYLNFTYLMMKSYAIITDSGGIQEEAPSLSKPVLVTRNTTERPEALATGAIELVGNDTELIFEKTSELLTNPICYNKMISQINPYGDGLASERIFNFLEKHLCP